MLIEILELVLPFSIPLTAIGGVLYLIAQKQKQKLGIGPEERQVLLELKAENAELRRRLDAVETIVSDIDTDLLLVHKKASGQLPPKA